MTVATYKLPIGDTLKTAWHKVKGSKGAFWTGIGATILISLGIAMVMVLAAAFNLPSFVVDILRVAGQVVNNLVALGLAYLGIRRAADLSIDINHVFVGFRWPIFLKLVGAFLLIFVFIYLAPLGLYLLSLAFTNPHVQMLWDILFVVAILIELYVFIKLALVLPLVLDKELNPWQAVKQSWHMTRGNFWRLVILFGLMIIFLALGALPFLIGLIWVLPFAYILYGLEYQRLLANNK